VKERQLYGTGPAEPALPAMTMRPQSMAPARPAGEGEVVQTAMAMAMAEMEATGRATAEKVAARQKAAQARVRARPRSRFAYARSECIAPIQESSLPDHGRTEAAGKGFPARPRDWRGSVKSLHQSTKSSFPARHLAHLRPDRERSGLWTLRSASALGRRRTGRSASLCSRSIRPCRLSREHIRIRCCPTSATIL